MPRITPTPDSTNSNFAGGSFPTRAVRNDLSTVTIWETLATESLGSPVRRAERRAFPGAKLHFRLLVSGTHTTVEIWLRFRASHWMTTTGLRNPGPEPAGAGRSAHQISPCEITTRFARESGEQQTKRKSLLGRQFRHRRCPSPRLLCRACGALNIPSTHR